MEKTTEALLDFVKEERSIHVYSGMITYFSQFSTEEVIDVSEVEAEFDGCYSTNNGRICFVSEGQVYVTPFASSTIETLKNHGFARKNFYVPFSNGDYPKEQLFRWSDIIDTVRKEEEKK